MTPISRRTALKGIGATLSLPLLDAMIPRARAVEAIERPVRMAVLYLLAGGKPELAEAAKGGGGR